MAHTGRGGFSDPDSDPFPSCITCYVRLKDEAVMDLRELMRLTALPLGGSAESLDVRGKESGKWPWESQDSGRRLWISDPRRRQPRQSEGNGSARLLRSRHGARSGSLDS
ncbi:hypothetical protein CRG98_012116 [Punica granatum]|uniref:Uncharacterized protein n=1 Tax=Punica granatum TaxID=22663 RepID=A0A2I0KGB0_PUNGR|nr:hypothetical protein CRG98_012116 [Punica granatum]